MLGRVYAARLGGGATCNDEPIRISERDPEEAICATGFPFRSKRDRLPQYFPVFERALLTFEDLRRAGAASLDLSWTAAGVLDGYFEQALGTWDVAAGSLLVREAGGVVTDWQGDDRAWLAVRRHRGRPGPRPRADPRGDRQPGVSGWSGVTRVKFGARPAEAQWNVATGKAGQAHGASNEPGDNPHATRLVARSLRPLRVAVLGRRLDQPRRQLDPHGSRAGCGRACTPVTAGPGAARSRVGTRSRTVHLHRPRQLPPGRSSRGGRVAPGAEPAAPLTARDAVPRVPFGTDPEPTTAVAAPTAQDAAHTVGGDHRLLQVVRRPARVVPLGARPGTAPSRPPGRAPRGDGSRELRTRDDRGPGRRRHRHRCLPPVDLGHHRARQVPPLGLRQRPRVGVLHRRHGPRLQRHCCRCACGRSAGSPSSCRS